MIDEAYHFAATSALGKPHPDILVEKDFALTSLPEGPLRDTAKKVMQFYYGAKFPTDGKVVVGRAYGYACQNKLVFEGDQLWTERIVKDEAEKQELSALYPEGKAFLIVTEAEVSARVESLSPEQQSLFEWQSFEIPTPSKEALLFLKTPRDGESGPKKVDSLSHEEKLHYFSLFSIETHLIPVLKREFPVLETRLWGKYGVSTAVDIHRLNTWQLLGI
jgi:hypothetical protein